MHAKRRISALGNFAYGGMKLFFSLICGRALEESIALRLNSAVLYCAYIIFSASRSAHQSEVLPLTHASAAQMQLYYKATVCKELAQGSCTITVLNPHSPRYRPSALTDRPPSHAQQI